MGWPTAVLSNMQIAVQKSVAISPGSSPPSALVEQACQRRRSLRPWIWPTTWSTSSGSQLEWIKCHLCVNLHSSGKMHYGKSEVEQLPHWEGRGRVNSTCIHRMLHHMRPCIVAYACGTVQSSRALEPCLTRQVLRIDVVLR